MRVQDCRTEPTAVLGWLLGRGSLSAPLGPCGMDVPSTCTHPEPALDSVGIWGHLLSFKEVEQRISTFSSCPISCVELCKDSAQQPGKRPQNPIWLPLLVLRPRALHSRHTTPQYAHRSTKKRNVAQLQGLGCALREVRCTSGILSTLPTMTLV